MNIPPHLEKTNKLYDRLVLAFGEQESKVQTHELIGKIFESCMNLAAVIGTAKNYARELPNDRPTNLQEVLQGGLPNKQIREQTLETVNILFEGAISQIERHVRSSNG